MKNYKSKEQLRGEQTTGHYAVVMCSIQKYSMTIYHVKNTVIPVYCGISLLDNSNQLIIALFTIITSNCKL